MSTAPQWRQQFERELAVYGLFRRQSPPVVVPRLIDADRARGVMLLEPIVGQPVAATRFPSAFDRQLLARILTDVRQLAQWRPDVPPEWRIEYPMRIDRMSRARLIAPDVHARLHELVTDAEREQANSYHFAHGDCELRNIVGSGANLGYVDWESAGSYLAGFDLALLWVTLGAIPGPRRVIEDLLAEGAVPVPAFLVNLGLLLVRELRLAAAHGAADRQAGLARDWVQVQQWIISGYVR